MYFVLFLFFFFKQKTAYDMRISDWSSDVCSSDLDRAIAGKAGRFFRKNPVNSSAKWAASHKLPPFPAINTRSEEHTSELQSLMRISYAVFCLKKKNKNSPLNTIRTRPRLQTQNQSHQEPLKPIIHNTHVII